MAQTLGQTPVGTIVKIPESGTPVDFIVAQQGNPNPSIYSTTFNNGTWLMREDTVGALTRSQAISNNNIPGIAWMNGTYKNTLDSNIANAIMDVKVPYISISGLGYLQGPVVLENGYSTQIFSISDEEIRLYRGGDFQGGTGVGLAYFFDAQSSLADAAYWVRGCDFEQRNSWNPIYRTETSSGNTIRQALDDGSSTTYKLRPVFLLSQSTTVLDDGTVSLGAVPVSSNAISISLIFMQGQPMNMTWQASPNADSYIVQRKSSADADWVQVQSGSGLSFSETVDSTWTTVQYRIAAVRDGNNSPWTETQVYNVVSTSSLLISGEDGSLGAIDSDVHYSVTTDTGNQITLTRLVNNVQVYTGQVSSGFTYDIPIVELPTGEGTIVINASVQTAGGLVSQSRTWTYTKTAMTFSTVGGISELDQNNQAVWPKTVMEAIRTYGFMGGTLDKTLMKLSTAVLRDPETGSFVDIEGGNAGAAQILVGSYVGTGQSGASNPTVITTPFEPIAIFLCSFGNTIYNTEGNNALLSLWPAVKPYEYLQLAVSTNYSATTLGQIVSINWDDNNVSFYVQNALYHKYVNQNGRTYYYIIFG